MRSSWRAAWARQDRLPRNVRWLAGMDVGFEDNGAITRAAAVLLDAETLKPMAQEMARIPTVMPYIPGLLSFRELPALLPHWHCCHERRTWCSSMATASAIRAGLASPRILAWSPICRASAWRNQTGGKVRRTGRRSWCAYTAAGWRRATGLGAAQQVRYKPLLWPVAIGSVPTPRWAGCSTLRGYRLPEPTRLADRLASRRDE